MELNHWYKGTELPDAECDCVVVYHIKKLGTSKLVGIAKISALIHMDKDTEFYFERPGYFSIPAGHEDIIAWMPIEYPKEVE